jgi:integrase/recombinase XerD
LNSGVGVYNYPRRLELALQKLAKDRKIRPADRAKILKFKDECVAQGLSTARVIRYVQMLSKLSAMLDKTFESATRDDIVRVVGKIERSSYSDWTKQSYKIALKRFYKWLRDADSYPPEVRWLKATGRRTTSLLPEELLTEEDVKRLAETADNPRDRALVQVLYETGCRAGEILSLKIKHMRLDADGAILIVTGKTGMRRVKIYWSQPALTEWISNHPHREDPEAPLWLSIGTKSHNEQLTYEAFRATLRRLANRISLKKPVNPHIFRHSRASWLAARIPEAAMKQYLGWMQDSKMAATYVHLSGRDVDAAMRKLQGLDKGEEQAEEESKLKVRTCPRCREKNSPVSKFCSRCGSVIDIQTALEIQEKRSKADELLNILVEDPEVLQLLQRKIIEKNLA